MINLWTWTWTWSLVIVASTGGGGGGSVSSSIHGGFVVAFVPSRTLPRHGHGNDIRFKPLSHRAVGWRTATLPSSVRTTACSSSSTSSTKTPTSLGLGDFFGFGSGTNKNTKEGDNEEETVQEKGSANTKGEKNNENDDDDLVTGIFKFFFGDVEERPMGLDRFDATRFPEQYPATIDEWAAPLEADNGNVEMATIRPFLKNTNLEFRPLTLSYDADRDGWDPVSFHAAVDRKGPAVVLCTTDNKQIVCGGYNPKGWVGYGEARGSIAAFLFRVHSGPGGKGAQGDPSSPPGIKLRKVGGPGLAQMDLPESGPSFGADSLVIPLNAQNNPRLARSKLGSYYERIDGTGNSLFGEGLASVTLASLKVFHGVYGEDEYVPFTDAEPFALY